MLCVLTAFISVIFIGKLFDDGDGVYATEEWTGTGARDPIRRGLPGTVGSATGCTAIC